MGMYLPPSHVLYMHFSLIFLFRCGDNGPFPALPNLSALMLLPLFIFLFQWAIVGGVWTKA